MHVITLDATNWTYPQDFHAALAQAMGAPAWYGHNLDALCDALTGDIWALKPPYSVVIHNAPTTLHGFLKRAEQCFADARVALGIDVTLRL